MANARSPLDSCSLFTRGGAAPAPDHDATHAARTVRLGAEKALLVDWAKENGRLRTAARFIPEFARGGEHGVYFNKARQRYFKATLPDRKLGYGIALGSYVQGAVPSEYLDRLALQNIIFGDDIKLEFIQENQGTPIIFTSQPAIRGTSANQADLDGMMHARGYERLAEGAYYDAGEGLLIFDLFPRNAIQAVDGLILPIDPVIQRIDAEFADFLRHHPNTINQVW